MRKGGSIGIESTYQWDATISDFYGTNNWSTNLIEIEAGTFNATIDPLKKLKPTSFGFNYSKGGGVSFNFTERTYMGGYFRFSSLFNRKHPGFYWNRR